MQAKLCAWFRARDAAIAEFGEHFELDTVRSTLEDQKAKAVWRMGPGSSCRFVSCMD